MDSFMKELVGDITDVQIVDDSPSSYIPERLLSPNTSFDVYEDDDGSSQFQGPIESYCFSSSSSSLFHEEDTATKFQQHCPSPSSVLDIAGCCSTPTSTTNRSYGSDKILDGFRERQRLIRESFMKSPGIVVESSFRRRRRRSPTTPSLSSRRTSYSPTAPRKQLNDDDSYSNLRTKLDGVRLF